MSQSVWGKLATFFRGATHEAVQAANDKGALVILDQEIRDAERQQNEAKEALTGILAKQKLQEDSIAALSNDIDSYTQKATKAVEMGNQELALEIAAVIGQKSQARDTEQALLDQYKSFADKQRNIVINSDSRIKAARQQADVAKARDSIQKAQKNVLAATGSTTGGLNNAMDSLNRIRQRQDETDAKFEAREALDNEMNGQSLEQKMKDAGLSDDKYGAANILAGLQKKNEA